MGPYLVLLQLFAFSDTIVVMIGLHEPLFYVWILFSSITTLAESDIFRRTLVLGGDESADGLPLQQQMEVKEGDNPCQLLKQCCQSFPVGSSYESCFKQLHPIVLKQMTKDWSTWSSKVNVNESFFIDCQPLDYAGYGWTVVSSSSSSEKAGTVNIEFDNRNVSGFTRELLEMLKKSMNDDESSLETFRSKQNKVKLSDIEQAEFYGHAIQILPNNLFIVNQFGLTLMYIGREDKARRLYEHAVARGMWENVMQRPTLSYISGLTSLPWHNKADYPFIAKLEAGYAEIKEELQYNLQERRGVFTEDSENIHRGGDWSMLKLKSRGNEVLKHTVFFPKTMNIISNCGAEFIEIKFSALKPGTHIRPHTGPFNGRLRTHLALVHSGGAEIRVGHEWRTWKEGEAMILDSSFEHEVRHTGSDVRIILILDIWHPELPENLRVVNSLTT